MTVVAIIPARGGSKGIKGKNTIPFGGKPLISYILQTAGNVKEIDRIIVSTEDPVIAKAAVQYGAEVPFIRPAELAMDETPTLPVLQHALSYLETKENYSPDIVVLLYATSPLLRAERIAAGIHMMNSNPYDSVISVEEDYGHYWKETPEGLERFYPPVIANRQYVKPLYKENGAIYIARRHLLVEKNELVGGHVGLLLMEKGETIDIDSPADLQMAEFVLHKSNTTTKQ